MFKLTIERWMCPVIHVILTSVWEKKKQRTNTEDRIGKKGS